jgi:hypothetical protein
LGSGFGSVGAGGTGGSAVASFGGATDGSFGSGAGSGAGGTGGSAVDSSCCGAEDWHGAGQHRTTTQQGRQQRIRQRAKKRQADAELTVNRIATVHTRTTLNALPNCFRIEIVSRSSGSFTW